MTFLLAIKDCKVSNQQDLVFDFEKQFVNVLR